MPAVVSASERKSATIADAVASILASEGFGALSVKRVAVDVGCTEATVRQRGANPRELAAFAWQRLLARPTRIDLVAIVDGVTGVVARGDTDMLTQALMRMTQRTLERDAFAELLVVANTNAEVLDVFVHELRDAVVTRSGLDRPAERAALLYALGLGAGLLLNARYPWAGDRHLRAVIHERVRQLGLCREPDPEVTDAVLDAMPQYVEGPRPLATHDPTLSALLAACLAQVAERGYDAVTVRAIAAAAGTTHGLAFSRYDTKMDLVADALRRNTTDYYEAFAQAGQQAHAQYGPALSGASYHRQLLMPQRTVVRALALEATRISWHHASSLNAAIEGLADFYRSVSDLPGWGTITAELDYFLDVCAGLGLMLIPRFDPTAWRLPWICVTTEHARARIAD